jgi:hypothetical protein
MQTIFLFGEAEKGAYCTPILCPSLPVLAETLGNPPEESLGIQYAVQTLLFERQLIYFRVKEEGFSFQDYMKGLRCLQERSHLPKLTAICMPGVGDSEIIETTSEICHLHKSLLILTEKDLFDYLTAK